ncbi:MAG: DegT/DnrJ/EryC1/StrS family aminotransferase [Candidatus Staskawiczbacteria bacterium]|nr:DegT/DnrJ/EryC1/StrS family aminotransferase [Candidatus Staskawiczbacteria bacterium]
MFKPISISLSPNVEPDDIGLVFKLILSCWKWKRGPAIKKLEDEFKKYLDVKHAFSFNSGRSCLFAILKALNLPENTEVLLQAFTCNAAVNPILWQGLKPIFVDCDENSFNIDVEDLKNKKGDVLIVQHTFGLPANMDEVLSIVRQNELILIEDCAHALGAEYKNKKVGTFGKAGFFSFSRDKVISSIYGGMVVTNDDVLAKKLEKLQNEFGYPSYFWIFQQLLHPILLNFIILPIYNFLDLGKIFLILSQWLHILSKAVHKKEKRGGRPNYFPRALPNALAIIAHHQFSKLNSFHQHRQELSKFYYQNLKGTSFDVSDSLLPGISDISHSFLRFTIKHPKAHEIIYNAWQNQNILIGDWYTSPIAPADTKLEKMQYKTGSCPTAEKLSKITFNLPTHINISKEDAQRIINFLEKWK